MRDTVVEAYDDEEKKNEVTRCQDIADWTCVAVSVHSYDAEMLDL